LVSNGRKRRVESLHVVVREGSPLASRHHGAHDDAVVRERVVQHEISGSEKRRDRSDIGRVSAHISQTAALPVMVGQRPLERAMDGPLAGDQSARRGGNPVPVNRALRRPSHRRRVIESEIVVGGKIEERPVVDGCRRARVCVVNEKIGVAKS
jgi:hypothetical protein